MILNFTFFNDNIPFVRYAIQSCVVSLVPILLFGSSDTIHVFLSFVAILILLL